MKNNNKWLPSHRNKVTTSKLKIIFLSLHCRRKIYEKLKAQAEDRTICQLTINKQDFQGGLIGSSGAKQGKSLAGGPAPGLSRNNYFESRLTPEGQASCWLSASQTVLGTRHG